MEGLDIYLGADLFAFVSESDDLMTTECKPTGDGNVRTFEVDLGLSGVFVYTAPIEAGKRALTQEELDKQVMETSPSDIAAYAELIAGITGVATAEIKVEINATVGKSLIDNLEQLNARRAAEGKPKVDLNDSPDRANPSEESPTPERKFSRKGAKEALNSPSFRAAMRNATKAMKKFAEDCREVWQSWYINKLLSFDLVVSACAGISTGCVAFFVIGCPITYAFLTGLAAAGVAFAGYHFLLKDADDLPEGIAGDGAMEGTKRAT
jgi:hypothetical protein